MTLKAQHAVVLAVVLATGLVLAACGPKAPPPAPVGPTYYGDIQPLLGQHCTMCHTANGIAPFTLETFASASQMATVMASATTAKVMPPWPPDDACNSYHGDRSLADADIALIKQWAAAGAPEGAVTSTGTNPADQSAANPLGRSPDLVVSMPQPYVSPPTADTDDYHCFVIDPMLTTEQDVVGVQVVPGNARIVHHVILYEVETANVPQLEQLDPTGQGYTCFGDAHVQANWVAAWAPGGTAEKFPDTTGIRLHPGSKLVMQVHYNLLNGRDLSDQSQVQLYFSPMPVQNVATIQPIAQYAFDLAAGAKDVEVPFTYTVTPDVGTLHVWGVAGHMHLLGTAWKMWVEPASGPTECLLHLPVWNFHWQNMYFLDNPVTLNPGDTVHMSCVYDNSQAHQPIIQGVQQTARDVTWGESTTDEMCLGLVYLTSG